MAASMRGVHCFSRTACRIFNLKSNSSLLKSSGTAVSQVLVSSIRQNSSVLTLSPKTRQLLNSISKNNKWNKSVVDSINRSSSSAMLCLLTAVNSPVMLGLCCSSDELSTDGDEDSTNRKKRIYIVGLLNDDP